MNSVKYIMDVSEAGSSHDKYTTDYWPTEQIKVIAMKDGSFVLAIDVRYVNDHGDACSETCRILLDENDVPYIKPDADQGFSKETCLDEIDKCEKYINSTGHRCLVQGRPLMVLEDGMLIGEKSVVKFVGDCAKEPKVRRYFSGYCKSAGLNQTGMMFVSKYIENPENQAVLSERVRKPSEEERVAIQQEINGAMQGFFGGTVNKYDLIKMIEIYNLIEKQNGMNPNGVIEFDIAKFENAFTNSQQQPE